VFTANQVFLIVHITVGVVLLHAFAGGLATFVRVPTGVLARRIQVASVVGMAVLAWVTVISGTWMIYPGYRAEPPAGAALDGYPKAWLVSAESTAWWHEFGMEWKEHVGWLAPFLATAVAVIVLVHGETVRQDPRVRRVLGVLFTTAFAATLVAAAFGAAINKVAPNDFLMN
jgi:Ca2+/Na+ antiporter